MAGDELGYAVTWAEELHKGWHSALSGVALLQDAVSPVEPGFMPHVCPSPEAPAVSSRR